MFSTSTSSTRPGPDGEVVIDGIDGPVVSVTLLAAGGALPFGQKESEVRFRISEDEQDLYDTVIRMTIEGAAIRQIGLASDKMELRWDAFGHGSYTIEYIDGLSSGNWQSVAGLEWPRASTFWEGEGIGTPGHTYYLVRSERPLLIDLFAAKGTSWGLSVSAREERGEEASRKDAKSEHNEALKRRRKRPREKTGSLSDRRTSLGHSNAQLSRFSNIDPAVFATQ